MSSSDLLIAPELLGLQTGDDIAPGAQLYTAPFAIDESTTVKARVLRGTIWSALTDALFTVELPLRVTELNYHPGDRYAGEIAAGFVDDDEFEFIELENVSASATVDLSGVRIADGVEFTFGDDTLAPGEHIVVVRNRTAFEHRYGPGIRIAGEYGNTPQDFKLNNAGESVTLLDAGGGIIQSFAYQDNWYRATDGAGPTLVVVDSHAARDLWNHSTQWRASYDSGGSPGSRDRMIGDVNDDLRVNLSDLAILQSHSGMMTGATWDAGDFNRDGAVNRIDAAMLAARFGRSISSPASPAAPEAAIATFVTASRRPTDSDRIKSWSVLRTSERVAMMRSSANSIDATDLQPRMLAANRILHPTNTAIRRLPRHTSNAPIDAAAIDEILTNGLPRGG